MKWFLRIATGIVLLIVLLFSAAGLYLTDERLRAMVLPHLKQMVGDKATVDVISYSLFRSFPDFGLIVGGLHVPAPNGTTLMSLDELRVNLELIPLLRKELSIASMVLEKPSMTYVMASNGTSNIDFLFRDATPDPSETAIAPTPSVNLKKIIVRKASLVYNNRQQNLLIRIQDLDFTTSVKLGDMIATDLYADVGSLTVNKDRKTWLAHFPLQFSQRSELDLVNEVLTISGGSLNIRGLSLNTSGIFSRWSSENPFVNLHLESASDDFGVLLDMVPEALKEDLKGVETRGILTLQANLEGELGDEIPPFTIQIGITDGYLKHPMAALPVESVQGAITVNNERALIERLSFRADMNTVSVNGLITSILSDAPEFELIADAHLDLDTIEKFYPVEDLGLVLRGLVTANVTASGELYDTGTIRFVADGGVQNGYIKFEDIGQPIEDINLLVNATQDLVTIRAARARASVNEISLTGSIAHPLDSVRTRFDLRSEARFDLSSVGDFFPESTDTLQLRGQLTFNGRAQGRLLDLDNAVVNASLQLANGYVNHRDFPEPVRNLSLNSRISNNEITLHRLSAEAGQNTFSGSGTVRQYLSDAPVAEVRVQTSLVLDELTRYLSLQDAGMALSGKAAAALNLKGRIPVQTWSGESGPDLSSGLTFSGTMTLTDASVTGDSIPTPITGMNGELVFTNRDVELKQFRMHMASSDINLSGNVVQYMHALEAVGANTPAELTSAFTSRMLNLDELYEWEETPEDAPLEPFPIELPNIHTSLTARVDSMIFLGMTISNIRGTARTTTRLVELTQASATIFEGGVSGAFTWDIPQPDRTKIAFRGDIANVRAEAFFREFKLGGKSKLHEYLSGGFTANVDYTSDMDVYLQQDWTTTVANGTFGMDRSRLKNHPIQNGLADLLSAPEFRDMSLDRWTATYTIKDGIFTMRDMNLTSTDIGLSVNGSQNLITDQLNFRMSLALPNRYNERLERIITKDGVEALRKDENTIIIPLLLTGTSENPRVVIDRETLQNMITDYLKKKAGDDLEEAARRLIRGVIRN